MIFERLGLFVIRIGRGVGVLAVASITTAMPGSSNRLALDRLVHLPDHGRLRLHPRQEFRLNKCVNKRPCSLRIWGRTCQNTVNDGPLYIRTRPNPAASDKQCVC